MLILDFFRYLRGYVHFEAEGRFLERFLNLAARARIPIWDVRRFGERFTGSADASSYNKLRKQAKKADVRIRISGKKGLPFTRRRYLNRHGLLIGAAIFFVFIFLMSQFVWRIEINGAGSIPHSRIIDALHDIGISPGTFCLNIDVRDSERRILLKVPELAWAALNIEASTVRVELDERTLPPDVVNSHDPCNIIADESGQITAMNVFDGQAMVSVGDSVLKGDILVSGITKDMQEQNLFKHARAEIFARCEFDFNLEIPLNQSAYVETGEIEKRTYIDIFGFDLPLFLPFRIASPYHIEQKELPITFLSFRLPFSALTESYHLMRNEPFILTEEEAKEQAMLELKSLEAVHMGDGEILKRTLNGHLKDGSFIMDAHYIAIIDIASQKRIILSTERK